MAELSNKLLNIPELLEIIFSNTRNTDLVVCRHVCRQMRSVIDESSPMQRKLFRLPTFPAKPKAIGWIVSDLGRDFAYVDRETIFKLDLIGIPSFDTASSPDGAHYSISLPSDVTSSYDPIQPPIRAPPAVPRLERSTFDHQYQTKRNYIGPSIRTVRPALNAWRPTRRIYKIDTYYRSMYLTQPPMKEIVWITYDCLQDSKRKVLVFSCDTGLTLGHLLDVFAKEIRDHTCDSPDYGTGMGMRCYHKAGCLEEFRARAVGNNLVRDDEVESSSGKADLVLKEAYFESYSDLFHTCS